MEVYKYRKGTHWRQRPREQRVSVPPLSSPKVDSPVIQSFFTPCVTVGGWRGDGWCVRGGGGWVGCVGPKGADAPMQLSSLSMSLLAAATRQYTSAPVCFHFCFCVRARRRHVVMLSAALRLFGVTRAPTQTHDRDLP